jgi:hypothetical protein
VTNGNYKEKPYRKPTKEERAFGTPYLYWYEESWMVNSAHADYLCKLSSDTLFRWVENADDGWDAGVSYWKEVGWKLSPLLQGTLFNG